MPKNKRLFIQSQTFGATCRVLKVTTISNATGTTKNFSKTPPKDPWTHQIWFKPKRRVRDYLVLVSKIDPMARATKTKVNQVLGSPLQESTRRVEPITSKAMVSKEVSVLAKSQSEEGSQNPISPRGVVLEEHSLYLS